MGRHYAHPEVLVSTDWVKNNLGNSKIKLIEIDVDTAHYEIGHIPGAIGFNWQTQLQDQLTRDIITKEQFEILCGEAGISSGDTIIVYGDSNNWFAAYGFWLFKMYGHKDLRLMNGGRQKWLDECEDELVTEKPAYSKTRYQAQPPDTSLRAMLVEVMEASQRQTQNLIDVRSTAEFTGKVTAGPGMIDNTMRGGHIPGAKSIPWGTAVNINDGTFKSFDELRSIYLNEKIIDPKKPFITYCRIGERSSHTWFVLKYLLGIENVKNYDGSWAEYGNLVGAPIEK